MPPPPHAQPCCRSSINEYESRVWPIVLSTTLRCSRETRGPGCGRLWRHDYGGEGAWYLLSVSEPVHPIPSGYVPVDTVPSVVHPVDQPPGVGSSPAIAWQCLIGVRSPIPVGNWGDVPMRRAVADEFRRVTGHAPDYCFSGWSAQPTPEQWDVIHDDWRGAQTPDADAPTASTTIRDAGEAVREARHLVRDHEHLYEQEHDPAYRHRESSDAGVGTIDLYGRWVPLADGVAIPARESVYGWTDAQTRRYLSGIVADVDGRNVLVRKVQHDVLDVEPPTVSPDTHPMQPIVRDAAGVSRFKENALVTHIFHGHVYLPARDAGAFSAEDHRQLAQLLGYSLGLYRTLAVVRIDPAHRALLAEMEAWDEHEREAAPLDESRWRLHPPAELMPPLGDEPAPHDT